MAFTAWVMYAQENNFTQLYLPTLRWKDLFGTNKPTPHEVLFDVVHWNSFYPALPRFVGYHESFVDVDPKSHVWKRPPRETYLATHPYIFGRQTKLFSSYKEYTSRSMEQRLPRHPVEVLMFQGAFRPHPLLEMHIAKLHKNMGTQGNNRVDRKGGYLCLHARVEPDMQVHTFCPDRKVRALRDIVANLTSYLDQPTISKVIVAIYRKRLERDGLNVTESGNVLAGENLQLFNEMLERGLWNGSIPVFEAGSHSLDQHDKTTLEYFGRYQSITGSVLNFFLAVESDIFVGTPVSSFSTDVIATRFYRNLTESYFYLPQGIIPAVEPTDKLPPRFSC